MSCPNCKSESVVSKAEAWDALTRIPPKVQDELDHLRLITAAARDVAMWAGHTSPDAGMVTIEVYAEHADALRELFGMKRAGS